MEWVDVVATAGCLAVGTLYGAACNTGDSGVESIGLPETAAASSTASALVTVTVADFQYVTPGWSGGCMSAGNNSGMGVFSTLFFDFVMRDSFDFFFATKSIGSKPAGHFTLK